MSLVHRPGSVTAGLYGTVGNHQNRIQVFIKHTWSQDKTHNASYLICIVADVRQEV